MRTPLVAQRPGHRFVVRTISLAMLSCVAGACSILTDPDGSDSGVTARVSSFPAWSTDGTTVYFSDRKGGGITEIAVKAVDVQSGRVRTLGMIQGLNHAEQLRTTADPASVYATVAHADWSLQLSIHRVPTTGGSLEPVATNVGLPWFVVSNTGNRIAYTGPRYDSDTLFVVDPGRTEGGGVALPAIGTRPVSMGLSPDGTMLVYTSSAGIHVVPTAGGIHRPVWRSAPGEVATLAPQVSWRGTTPRLLIAVDTVLDGTPILELYDLDGETAERVALGTVPRPLVGAHRTQLAWSADGRAYAIWVPVEVVRQNVERTTYRFRLYIREAGTSTARAALELTSDQPLTWFEFSPDGRQVALLLNGSLRVLPVSAP